MLPQSMTRITTFTASALLLLASMACTATVEPTGQGTGTQKQTGGDAAACIVEASSYDQSCTQDSDCVLVPAGGDVCDPCGNAGTLYCTTAAVNATVSGKYLAALAPAASGITKACGPISCPLGGYPATSGIPQAGGSASKAACKQGLCTWVNPPPPSPLDAGASK
jgi:hypothetical protein